MKVVKLPLVLRVAILVLAFGVFVCLALPMSQSDAPMSIGMACCFTLAILLGLFLMGRPHRTLYLSPGAAPRSPAPRRVLATARAPDPISLCALLI